jgi:hypothetical protein
MRGGDDYGADRGRAAATDEMYHERGSGAAMPAVPMQNRNARMADALSTDSAMGSLRQAEEAVQAGRFGQANEFLERAATRLLTRATPADRANVPMAGGGVQAINDARAAVMRRDRAEAQRQIRIAMGEASAVMAERGGASSMTGAGTGVTPGYSGGGGGMGADPYGRPGVTSAPGSGMPTTGRTVPMRDSGVGASGVSRADLILAQTTPRTDRSGNLGTPQTQPQPGGGVGAGPGAPGSASPSASAQPGRGAPPPGSATATPGGGGTSGGNVTPGGAIRPGSPGGGTGTGGGSGGAAGGSGSGGNR